MINAETAITISGLEKLFKNLNVLNGISFSVKKGSIFALLGSNGAGKTTIVKILATLRHLNHPRQVADDLLKRFGLTAAADRKTSTYSGGMRRRLDIAKSKRRLKGVQWRKSGYTLFLARLLGIFFQINPAH